MKGLEYWARQFAVNWAKPSVSSDEINALSHAYIQGIKEGKIVMDGKEIRVAVAHGLGNAADLLDMVRKEPDKYHFIEIMGCPGGCIGGGGQPRFTTNDVRRERMKAIFAEDEGKQLRLSHENPSVALLYRDFLGQPLGEKSHHLLHTHYHARSLN